MPRERIHMQTVGHVLTAMCKTYGRAKAGKMAWADASLASLILLRIRSTIEVGDIEKRLEALEARLGGAPPKNGHAGNGARPGTANAADATN